MAPAEFAQAAIKMIVIFDQGYVVDPNPSVTIPVL